MNNAILICRHNYKKYYKDYSVVDRDGFCDEGESNNG